MNNSNHLVTSEREKDSHRHTTLHKPTLHMSIYTQWTQQYRVEDKRGVCECVQQCVRLNSWYLGWAQFQDSLHRWSWRLALNVNTVILFILLHPFIQPFVYHASPCLTWHAVCLNNQVYHHFQSVFYILTLDSWCWHLLRHSAEVDGLNEWAETIQEDGGITPDHRNSM